MTNRMLIALTAAVALALGSISPALAEDPPADDAATAATEAPAPAADEASAGGDAATTTGSTEAPADDAPAAPAE